MSSVRRQQELEDLHSQVEYQYRCLAQKSDDSKTEEDRQLEETLLEQLIETVHQRNSIIDSIETDRLRYAEEDKTIDDMLQASGFAETVSKKFKGHRKEKELKKAKKKKKEANETKAKKSLFRMISSRSRKSSTKNATSPTIISKPL